MAIDIVAFISQALTVFSAGGKAIERLANNRRDVQPVGSGSLSANVHALRLEALESRLGDIESYAREQRLRLDEVDRALKDSLRAIEALADRMNTIFWTTVVAGILALI